MPTWASPHFLLSLEPDLLRDPSPLSCILSLSSSSAPDLGLALALALIGMGSSMGSSSCWNPSSSYRIAGGRKISTLPIPYHGGPLQYEPEVQCYCGKKAARRISWSDRNPGRRYLCCYSQRTSGCNYWRWDDEELSPFLRELVGDLRDAVNSLKNKNIELKDSLAVRVCCYEGSHQNNLTTMVREKDETIRLLRDRV